MKWLLIAVLALVASPTCAHDAWIDGTPVPDWVKSWCCGPSDAHHYRFDEVKVTPNGFVLPDYPGVIPMEKAIPSEDGEYWAFWKKYDEGGYSEVYCFFAPPGST